MTAEYSRCYAPVNSRRYPTTGYNGGYMTLGKRIKGRRAEIGMSQDELAQKAGVKQPTIAFIEGGRNKGSTYVVQLSSALRVNAQWLATGKGPKESSNVKEGPEIRAKVPLISWTTAGRWAETQDPFPPGEGEEWISTIQSVGPNAFALRVVGDSMEPKIPDGSIVIIDPGVQHAHGRIVLAKRTSDQQATLKQLWFDGATPSLRPLNARYPILDMPDDTRIIGVAVGLHLTL